MAYKDVKDRKAYHRKWYRKNRKHRIKQIHENRTKRARELQAKTIEYLSNHPCVDCNNKDIIVLDFDHVRGKKEGDISRMIIMGYSWKKIKEEIEKCEVRCANCHRRRTAFENGYYKALVA